MMKFNVGARQLTLEEVKTLCEPCKDKNPTIENLIFIETCKTAKCGVKVFPCYVMDYWKNEKKGDSIVIDVIQFVNGNYGVLTTNVPVSGMGTKYRLWTLPPTEEILQLHQEAPLCVNDERSTDE